MLPYRLVWPLIRKLDPESAHQFGLWCLRWPLPLVWSAPQDPLVFQDVLFRNRIGIAAGFDKNATVLRGCARMGVGFVEVGTILVEPWAGNPPPRLRRIEASKAVWNRLGFPNDGLREILPRLAAFPRGQRDGMAIGCNIGPHPGHLKAANNADDYLRIAAGELNQLVDALAPHADFFVVNFSSPNTQGLRNLLRDPRLTSDLIAPLKQRIGALTRTPRPPLLVKLPPEDPDRQLWTRESLSEVIGPLIAAQACDGFVAVNTSTRLAKDLLGEDLGGLSGGPLLSTALDAVALVRSLCPFPLLVIGCGGVTQPQDAVQFLNRGADLVELYTGLIYGGPTLPADCSRAMMQSGLHPSRFDPTDKGKHQDLTEARQ